MPRILLADDHIEQSVLLQQLLENLSHRVDIALSTADTLRQLERSQPDLVVMDLRFPRAEDGLALIRAIRQAGRQMAVIVLSGWPDEIYETLEETMVSRVLVKGNVRELLDAVAELLPSSQP